MKLFSKIVTLVVTSLLLVSCTQEPPPKDKNGDLPQDVLLKVYDLMKSKKYDEAQKYYSPTYIKELVTDHKRSFQEYAEKEVLNYITGKATCEKINNSYHDQKWEITLKMVNPAVKKYIPGRVCNLAIQDGEWKIVLWTEYKK